MSHHEGRVIGVMMKARALMELIVINVGFDLGVISQQVFTMLMLMAISVRSSRRRDCGSGCRRWGWRWRGGIGSESWRHTPVRNGAAPSIRMFLARIWGWLVGFWIRRQSGV
jgi:Kef-type K+ transport system membrane component KefB